MSAVFEVGHANVSRLNGQSARVFTPASVENPMVFGILNLPSTATSRGFVTEAKPATTVWLTRQETGIVFRYPYTIARESFFCEMEDDLVFLRHESWSLMGTGESLMDAELSLLQEARELLEVMTKMPVESLDFETLRLRDFVLRLV